ncbi:MAG: YbjN domain-containing protein [Rhodospirillales bacterium]|jgi:hypothetical protein|nr:YbjN domain-containing protein [Rhodospirillales bacterium]MDP6773004.1 YbjN domain-containing protein [Rhodospirillales bacterium]|tara:strand:- start:46 stop:549 length:504 start_codon:yes stop_codon:yes gene_type:complete
MGVSSHIRDTLAANPLDIVEQVAFAHDWAFDRRSDEEMAIQVPGNWCDYSLYFAWNTDAVAVQLTCAFDMRVPPAKQARVHELLALINEHMWLGHFSLWNDEGLPMFRHALPLRGAGGPTIEQMGDIVETAIADCDRYYPAFQFVIWGERTAAEAVAVALVDTMGEA